MVYLLIIHLISSFILIRMIWFVSGTYNIPITFSNFPIIMMAGIGLIAAIYLIVTHFMWCLPMGILVGIVLLMLNTLTPNSFTLGNALTSVAAIFLWPEIIVFLAFYLGNINKINEHEKSQS